MKTERELFEEAIVEKCGFNPRTSFELSDVTGEYKSDVTYFAWIMWQASISREGYKLVPVEINDEIESAMFSSVARGDMPCEIYKAMIEAVEK